MSHFNDPSLSIVLSDSQTITLSSKELQQFGPHASIESIRENINHSLGFEVISPTSVWSVDPYFRRNIPPNFPLASIGYFPHPYMDIRNISPLYVFNPFVETNLLDIPELATDQIFADQENLAASLEELKKNYVCLHIDNKFAL